MTNKKSPKSPKPKSPKPKSPPRSKSSESLDSKGQPTTAALQKKIDSLLNKKKADWLSQLKEYYTLWTMLTVAEKYAVQVNKQTDLMNDIIKTVLMDEFNRTKMGANYTAKEIAKNLLYLSGKYNALKNKATKDNFIDDQAIANLEQLVNDKVREIKSVNSPKKSPSPKPKAKKSAKSKARKTTVDSSEEDSSSLY